LRKIIAKFAICFIAIILLPFISSANIDYHYDVIGSKGQVGLTGLGIYPSINDNGVVAFVGRFSVGQGIFIGNGTTDPKNIIPIYYSRDLGDSVQINNNNKIAGRDRLSGNPPKFRIQIWDVNAPDTYSTVAMGGGIFDSYDSVIGPVSMNNNGQTVFAALKGSSELMTTSAFIGPNEAPVRFSIRPKIDDTGHIVVQTYDYIRLYNYDLGAFETIASPTNGFTLLGKMPGISDDGSIIVFAGDRGNGPGIFASIKEGGSRIMQKIAGENGGPSLGNDSSGNPINFSSFDVNGTVAVIHQEFGSAGLANDSFVVTFMATPAAASPGNFTAQMGIWTVRVDAWTPTVGQYKINTPSQVMQIGDMFLSGTAAGLIEDLNMYDPIAIAPTRSDGNPRTQLPGEHRLAFWAKTSSGEMVVRASNTSDKPDLKINSSSISLSPNKVNITVHNVGNSRADLIKIGVTKKIKGGVVVIQTDSLNQTIASILPGEKQNVSVAWNVSDFEDVDVTLDPDNSMNEQNESNNFAETHKITGRVTEDVSGIGVLKYAKVEFKEKVGTTWETKYLTFSGSDGKYIIPLNNENISQETEVRVNVSLEFSPDKNLSGIKARFYSDAQWGANIPKNPLAKPISKSISISNSLDKEKDYPYNNFKFNLAEGGSTYQAFVNAYEYFKKPTVNFEINNPIDVEVADNDYASTTSYYDPVSNSLHIWHQIIFNTNPGLPQLFFGKDEVAHEYAHRAANSWVIPYGPTTYLPQDALGENWANFGSTLARKHPMPDSYSNYSSGNYSLSAAWMYSMGDIWWTLDHRDISTPNNVVNTLKTGPRTVKAFYDNYSIIRGLTIPQRQWLKGFFRQHGYNTTGWQPVGPLDPEMFTNVYSDRTVDLNSDGLAELLRIDVGLNLTDPGNYIVYGYLYDPGRDSYCYARNDTFLNSGSQNASLDFSGNCINVYRLNGSYNLASVYLANESLDEIDFRMDAYTTGIYDYGEFSQPAVAVTGTYSDYGINTDGDGLFDELALNVSVNVISQSDYIIAGSLFDNSGNFIEEFSRSFSLDRGSQNVELRFNGASIYANKANGTFSIKGITVSDLNKHNYYIPDIFITKVYNYTQFQVPGASFIGTFTELAQDTDYDSLFNYLNVNADLFINSNGTYGIIGSITDASGHEITSANSYSDLKVGMQSLSLNIDGKIIRKSRLNGPYDLVITLYSNNSIIGKLTYTTSPYTYSQFQYGQDDYFNTSFSDHGTELDMNGLYDYLTIEASISTENTPGNYTFEGYLSDEDYNFVGYLNSSSYIDGNPRVLFFNFSGQNIWKNHYPEGIYRLNLKISDENNNKIGYLEDVYLTSNYSYDQFEVPQISTISDLTNTTYSSTYINWKWTDPTIADFASVNVWIDGVFKTNVPRGEQFYNASGFLPETEHTIVLKTLNNSGVEDPTLVTHTAWTAPLLIPPVISNKIPMQGTKFPIGTDSVLLSLQTDKWSECRLSETTNDFSEMTRFDITNSLFHLTTVNSLTNGKDYTLFINCLDYTGAQNNTEFFSFYIYNRTFLPPVVDPISDVTSYENETITIIVNATDPEDDPLTITVQDRVMFGYVPIASRFTVEEQTLNLTTNYNDAGRYYLRVSVSDGKDTVTRDFTLNIINVNRPPILDPIGSKIAIEGTFFSTNIIGNDPDGNDLRFSDNTSLFNINPFNGKISFTPKNYHVGDHYVNISVSDGEFTAYEVVLFHITNVNNPPIIEPILPRKAIPDELFTLQINATDPDNDNLTFSDDTDLFNISTQGLINFTPSRTDQGKYLINITVTDSLANDTKILNLVISSINRPPIITNITDRIIVYRNQSFEINVTACDPGIDAGCE